jgi:hypothetical protein
MKLIDSTDLRVFQFRIRNTDGLTVTERLSQSHLNWEALDVLVGNCGKKNKILIIFVIDAFYPSFKNVLKINYDKFCGDFSEYVESEINKKPLRKKNIFAVMNADWYIPNKQRRNKRKLIKEFVKHYGEASPWNRYPPFTKKFVRKDIDEFVLKIKTRYSTSSSMTTSSIINPTNFTKHKGFFYIVLPYRIPFEYVLNIGTDPGKNRKNRVSSQDRGYSLVSWSIEHEVIYEWDSVAEAVKKVTKNLDNLLSYDFTGYHETILIIFIFRAYNDRHEFTYDNEVLGLYSNFRRDFREYLNHAVHDSKLSEDNYFWEIDKAWYNYPVWGPGTFDGRSSRRNHPFWELVTKSTMEARKLIDETVEKLRKRHPQKRFRYIVLPESDMYKYVV